MFSFRVRFNFILFFILFFNSSLIKNKDLVNYWVIWNVGQGQWITHIISDKCLHYDVGGESGSFQNIRRKLIAACAEKENLIFLSHWDYDHYINIPSLVNSLKSVCWQSRPPLSDKQNISIKKILNLRINYCVDQYLGANYWIPASGKNTNQKSFIYLDEGVLLPGDSPQATEKIWAKKFFPIYTTEILILGHHGSRTSTSLLLLNKLPRLKLTIASARHGRYGHPHKETLTRLKKNKTPVLKTEDWGSIWIF